MEHNGNIWRTALTIGTGLLGGCVLGIVARLWMRLISDDPQFTWSGTITIVLAFTIFGFAQAVATVVHAGSARSRWALTAGRVVGAIGTLPLFVGAGGIMLPTVVAGGFAVHRADWPRWARIVCAVIAAVPIVVVGTMVVPRFGISPRSLLGLVLVVAIYGIVNAFGRSTFAPRPDGRRVDHRFVMGGVVLLSTALAGLAVGTGG